MSRQLLVIKRQQKLTELLRSFSRVVIFVHRHTDVTVSCSEFVWYQIQHLVN